jgi:hypothetical protein
MNINKTKKVEEYIYEIPRKVQTKYKFCVVGDVYVLCYTLDKAIYFKNLYFENKEQFLIESEAYKKEKPDRKIKGDKVKRTIQNKEKTKVVNLTIEDIITNANNKFNELKDSGEDVGNITFIVDKYIQRKGYKYRLIIKNKSLNYFKSFDNFEDAVKQRELLLPEVKRTKHNKDRRIGKIQVYPGIFELNDGNFFLQTSKKENKVRKIFPTLKEAIKFKETLGIDLHTNKEQYYNEIGKYSTEEHNWKQIDYLGKYWISEKGIIISYANKGIVRPLTFFKSKNGKLTFMLCNKESGRKHYFLHQLLAEKFIDNPNNYKYVIHIDGNVLNNALNNLKWVKKPVQTFNQIRKQVVVVSTTTNEVIKTYSSINECLRTYTDLSKSNLKTLSKNKTTYNNLTFEIIENKRSLPRNIVANENGNGYYCQLKFNNKRYMKYGFKTVDEAIEGLKKLKIIAINEK